MITTPFESPLFLGISHTGQGAMWEVVEGFVYNVRTVIERFEIELGSLPKKRINMHCQMSVSYDIHLMRQL